MEQSHALELRRWDSSAVDLPEGTDEPNLPEDPLALGRGLPSPIVLQPVVVPPAREFPQLREGENGSLSDALPLAPTIHMLFRPEEQHRGSCEADIAPPLPRGNGEVHDAGAAVEGFVADLRAEG